MKSIARPSFWKAYYALPEEVRKRARRVYRMWLNAPSHPGLEFKRVSERRPVYSARIDGHRVIGLLEGDTMTWTWIGNHDEYERLLKRM